MNTINTERLISLVEERPVIWDQTLEIYKVKNVKTSAWREICVMLKENFEEMEETQRQEFGKLVLKKWTQTRDTWMRCTKKHKQGKTSGSSVTPSRLYVFHEQMSFLKKINDPVVVRESTHRNQNEGANEETGSEESEVTLDAGDPRDTAQSANKTSTTTNIRRKRTINEVDTKMMTLIDHPLKLPQKENPENRHLPFFKSLLPSLASLNDDQTLQFHSDVISLLQCIKRQNETLFHNTSSSQRNFYEWQKPGYFAQSQPQSTGYLTSNGCPTQPNPSYSTQSQTSGYSTRMQNPSHSTQPQTSGYSIHMQNPDHPSQPQTSASLTEVSRSSSTESALSIASQDSDHLDLSNF